MGKTINRKYNSSRNNNMALRGCEGQVLFVARDNPLRIFLRKDKPKKIKVKKLGGRP